MPNVPRITWVCRLYSWCADRVIGITMVGNRRTRIWEAELYGWFFPRKPIFNFHFWLADTLQTPLECLRFWALRSLAWKNRKYVGRVNEKGD